MGRVPRPRTDFEGLVSHRVTLPRGNKSNVSQTAAFRQTTQTIPARTPTTVPQLSDTPMVLVSLEVQNVRRSFTESGLKVGMDSWPIAHALEKQYPSPPLHLDDPIVVRIRDHIAKLRDAIIPTVLPKVTVVLLNKVSADYFYKTREEHFGMSLQEFEKTKTADKCLEEAKQPAKEAGDLLRKHSGPYFLGETGTQCKNLVAFSRCVLT
jgi:hypothetical protein